MKSVNILPVYHTRHICVYTYPSIYILTHQISYIFMHAYSRYQMGHNNKYTTCWCGRGKVITEKKCMRRGISVVVFGKCNNGSENTRMTNNRELLFPAPLLCFYHRKKNPYKVRCQDWHINNPTWVFYYGKISRQVCFYLSIDIKVDVYIQLHICMYPWIYTHIYSTHKYIVKIVPRLQALGTTWAPALHLQRCRHCRLTVRERGSRFL